ncbi:MAG: RNA 3'-terminal phosphate cyclase [Planctomycetota bacterium]|nr:RNA 3'-terminal phosphate cyclase [Planctomycetota bacterium]
MIEIDGSFGEGGGQILRSSLALSLCTGQPFRINKIRAGRDKPGLMRQHLTAVQAAARIGSAGAEGANIGSTELVFTPGKVIPGDYQFAVGTAGSATLVLQTVLPALLTAPGPSRLVLEGGTHNPFAPPFDFLDKAFLPLVNRMGPRVTATLDRPGFYPAGGGRFTVEIKPAKGLAGFELLERGAVVSRRARAAVANLPRQIAERELRVVERRLGWPRECLVVEEAQGSPGPGNIVTIELAHANVTEVFTGFGERFRSAEAVAEAAVEECRRYLGGAAPVGEYLTDQILLPLALAGAGTFRSVGLSRHATTHMDLIAKFLGARVTTKPAGSHADGTIVSIAAS